MVSAFDLFKVGIGPSSSHTVGPMLAARCFRDALDERAACVRVELFGSLAWTGRGHGTDRAICLGLLGHAPATVDPDRVASLVEDLMTTRVLRHGRTQALAFDPVHDLIFNLRELLPLHPNGMRFRAFANDGSLLLERTCYSTGGGFVVTEGDLAAPTPPAIAYPFATASALLELCACTRLSIADLQRANEEAVRPRAAFAMAVNEENAAGGRVVTAPTNGAAGIVPAVLRYYRDFCSEYSEDGARRFLLTASAIGSLIKRNASISGAEAGCQGEVGSAAAMAAAGLAAWCRSRALNATRWARTRRSPLRRSLCAAMVRTASRSMRQSRRCDRLARTCSRNTKRPRAADSPSTWPIAEDRTFRLSALLCGSYFADMIPRTLYTCAHETFRQRAREFLANCAVPRFAAWEAAGHPDREFWQLAGSAGFLGYAIPEEYGGSGVDRRYGAILREEMARIGIGGTGLGLLLHADVIAPFIVRHGSTQQKQYWLPRIASGQTILALGMTERDAGSDIKNLATSAERHGDTWVINGSKIFITNAHQADLLVLAARTDATVSAAKGVSLLLVETDRAGCTQGPPMIKIGLKYEDAAELEFKNMRVPGEALLGEAGMGFGYLMQGMAWERMQIAIMAVATCEAVIERTVRHARGRRAFGQSLLEMQNTRFKLAECAAETRIGRLFVDRCVELDCAGQLDPTDAAVAKLWCTELQGRVTDLCVQLHGGWGVIASHPIARAYVDARVTRIYGGTNEVLREVIARTLPA